MQAISRLTLRNRGCQAAQLGAVSIDSCGNQVYYRGTGAITQGCAGCLDLRNLGIPEGSCVAASVSCGSNGCGSDACGCNCCGSNSCDCNGCGSDTCGCNGCGSNNCSCDGCGSNNCSCDGCGSNNCGCGGCGSNNCGCGGQQESQFFTYSSQCNTAANFSMGGSARYPALSFDCFSPCARRCAC